MLVDGKKKCFYSLMRVAMCKAIKEEPHPEIIHSFLLAHNAKPNRAEPLYHVARIYREVLQMPALGYIFAKRAAELPYPNTDILFITDEVYTWQALDELATCAHSVGDIHVGFAASKKLLEENRLPEEQLPRVQQNYQIYSQMVSKHQATIAQESLVKQMTQKMEKKQEKQDRKGKEKKSTKQKPRRQKMNK
jgi:hypothetical protein